MRALTLCAESRTAEVTEIPKPQVSGSKLLVRVQAVALNPVDALYVFNPLGLSGRVVGSDFGGIIEEIGEDTAIVGAGEQSLKVGTRVAGFGQGACSINPLPGSFAEYVVIEQNLVWKIAHSMSFAEAASISLCGLTAAQALFGEK